MGSVLALYVSPEARAPMVSVGAARALPGVGLEGDRYALGRGTLRAKPGLRRDLTLIAHEALQAAGLPAELCRRNVITVGVELGALIGVEFQIGAVRVRGERPCEPCFHLERLTHPGVRAALAGRGGLYAAILTEGELHPGDALER